jgi:hypothetical protein
MVHSWVDCRLSAELDLIPQFEILPDFLNLENAGIQSLAVYKCGLLGFCSCFGFLNRPGWRPEQGWIQLDRLKV